MTTPTQSPATASSEADDANFEKVWKVWNGLYPKNGDKDMAGHFWLASKAFNRSAYSSTEQELREARQLLEKAESVLKKCNRYRFAEEIKFFLSKNSNLTRE